MRPQIRRSRSTLNSHRFLFLVLFLILWMLYRMFSSKTSLTAQPKENLDFSVFGSGDRETTTVSTTTTKKPAAVSRIPAEKQKRILLAFYGVLARSRGCTWFSQKANVYDILRKAGYDVDVYVFNIRTKNDVDGRPLELSYEKQFKIDFYEESTDEELDARVNDDICHHNFVSKCAMQIGDGNPAMVYTPAQNINAMRQLLAEQKVGEYLRKHGEAYQGVFAMCPDYYLPFELSLKDLETVAAEPLTTQPERPWIFTTASNDNQGYTNGVYFGKPSHLIQVMTRYEIVDAILPSRANFEHQLRWGMEKRGVKRRVLKNYEKGWCLAKVRNSYKIRHVQWVNRVMSKQRPFDGPLLEELKKCTNCTNLMECAMRKV